MKTECVGLKVQVTVEGCRMLVSFHLTFVRGSSIACHCVSKKPDIGATIQGVEYVEKEAYLAVLVSAQY